MDMRTLFVLLLTAFSTNLTAAASSYQIDLILFAHQASATENEHAFNNALVPVNDDAIRLKPAAAGQQKNYQLLKASQSSLGDAYYQLTHKAQYKVLGHYSWRQPANSQSKVAIPVGNNKGWQFQGSVRVRQGNYYSMDTNLQFSPPDHPESALTLEQKQRLKPNVVYYLDHPQIGMLVNIH